jgi:hypothetical protein
MSVTLLRDGTRGDIARSARPYLVTLKGTGLIPLMASLNLLVVGVNLPQSRRAHCTKISDNLLFHLFTNYTITRQGFQKWSVVSKCKLRCNMACITGGIEMADLNSFEFTYHSLQYHQNSHASSQDV